MREADGFGERYEILRRLGEGGMGVVYEVRDRQRGALVALKTVQHLDAHALYHFKAEFRLLADIVHPGLVCLYDLVADGPRPFFTMELVPGRSFLAWLRGGAVSESADTVPFELAGGVKGPASDPGAPPGQAKQPCDIERLRGASRQLAEAILALHDAGIIHRDLKPSNVLVTPEGRVVVLDFGVAVGARPGHHASVMGIAGTVEYMSPEHATGGEPTRASDWYAFGVMLYEALAGRLSFEGPSMRVVLDKHSVDPSPPSAWGAVPEDLDALCRDLLDRNPQRRPPGAEILRRLDPSRAAARRPSLPYREAGAPFVGRTSQLRELHEALADATATGRPIVVHVRGRSGMGKSALLARFAEELASGPAAVVLAGRCYERESVPFKALDALVDDLTRYLRSLPSRECEGLLPTRTHALVQVFPVLERVPRVADWPRGPQEAPDPQELRRRAFRAFRVLLGRMTSRSPVVLVLDDIQWGDTDSAALLSELLRPPDAPPLLVVLSARTEEADTSPLLAALADALRLAEQRHVEAGPLSPDDAEQLAAALLGATSPSAPGGAQKIAEESRGSPYLIDELARFSGSGGGGCGEEPRLDEALHRRIAALPEESAALLRIVAVAGGVVSEPVATEAAGLRGDAARKAPARLRAERLLRGARSGTSLDTYHDRVRETLLAHLDAQARRSLHARLAEALSAAGGADPEQLAHHFGAAGDVVREVEWQLAAARKAVETLAFDRAAELYRKVLAAGGDGVDRIPTERALIEALTNAGRLADAAELRLGLAGRVDAAHALELRTTAAEQLLCSGRFDGGMAVLERRSGRRQRIHTGRVRPQRRVGS